ncbi:putative Zn peptidase [Mycobacterium sp. JS623]|uniref:ImmA/IrrE family metallo-endopeptidase n=1 Tax=Mycobacterium sp. JS623 TaxID=212767 RepID=UPI0002A582C9|nr:ImmA/IrrE family metallo-endopeptidase [Mycobacterium sp. JS623]AGB22131.1 putative Zn peptidase [Mycobacterium sp. JS623]
MHQEDQSYSTSVLAQLRAVIPVHAQVSFADALRVAELQANKLIELHGIVTGPVPTELISELPKLTVGYTGRLVSGATFWDKHHQVWVIQLSRTDSQARRRFTLAHEFKHIIDHGRQTILYRGTRRITAVAQAEQAADYFAGCLLVPRRLLKQAWGNGIQDPSELAQLFEVSEQAIAVRLRQTGLVDGRFRHVPRPFPLAAELEPEPDDEGEVSKPVEEEGLAA